MTRAPAQNGPSVLHQIYNLLFYSSTYYQVCIQITQSPITCNQVTLSKSYKLTCNNIDMPKQTFIDIQNLPSSEGIIIGFTFKYDCLLWWLQSKVVKLIQLIKAFYLWTWTPTPACLFYQHLSNLKKNFNLMTFCFYNAVYQLKLL